MHTIIIARWFPGATCSKYKAHIRHHYCFRRHQPLVAAPDGSGRSENGNPPATNNRRKRISLSGSDRNWASGMTAPLLGTWRCCFSEVFCRGVSSRRRPYATHELHPPAAGFSLQWRTIKRMVGSGCVLTVVCERVTRKVCLLLSGF